MKYETYGYIKSAEEDNWENGCLPNPEFFTFSDIRFESDSVEGLIEQLMEHFGTDDREAFELDACEELGRIDYQATENSDGFLASNAEIRAFKKGTCRLWLATYSITVEAVERKPVSLSSL